MSGQTQNSELLLILTQQYQDARTQNNTEAMANLLKAIRLITDKVESGTSQNRSSRGTRQSSRTAKHLNLLDSAYEESDESDESEEDGEMLENTECVSSSDSSSSHEECRRKGSKRLKKPCYKKATKKRIVPHRPPLKTEYEDEELSMLALVPGSSGSSGKNFRKVAIKEEPVDSSETPSKEIKQEEPTASKSGRGRSKTPTVSIKEEKDIIFEFGYPITVDEEMDINLEPDFLPTKSDPCDQKPSHSTARHRIKKEFVPAEEEEEIHFLGETNRSQDGSRNIRKIKVEAPDVEPKVDAPASETEQAPISSPAESAVSQEAKGIKIEAGEDKKVAAEIVKRYSTRKRTAKKK